MSTPSFKTCAAGHYYAASLESCPYCAESGTETIATPHISNNAGDKTEWITPGGETETYNPGMTGQNTVNIGGNKGSYSPPSDDRTMIRPSSKEGDNSQVLPGKEEVRQSRKLVGWLVSFSLDAMGLDFRLFEGQNKVGRDVSCNIRIIQDGGISSHHATILYRNGFYLRDEMATNPSYINGAEVPPGATMEIKDGDKLKFGGNEFLLRTAY